MGGRVCHGAGFAAGKPRTAQASSQKRGRWNASRCWDDSSAAEQALQIDSVRQLRYSCLACHCTILRPRPSPPHDPGHLSPAPCPTPYFASPQCRQCSRQRRLCAIVAHICDAIRHRRLFPAGPHAPRDRRRREVQASNRAQVHRAPPTRPEPRCPRRLQRLRPRRVSV